MRSAKASSIPAWSPASTAASASRARSVFLADSSGITSRAAPRKVRSQAPAGCGPTSARSMSLRPSRPVHQAVSPSGSMTCIGNGEAHGSTLFRALSACEAVAPHLQHARVADAAGVVGAGPPRLVTVDGEARIEERDVRQAPSRGVPATPHCASVSRPMRRASGSFARTTSVRLPPKSMSTAGCTPTSTACSGAWPESFASESTSWKLDWCRLILPMPRYDGNVVVPDHLQRAGLEAVVDGVEDEHAPGRLHVRQQVEALRAAVHESDGFREAASPRSGPPRRARRSPRRPRARCRCRAPVYRSPPALLVTFAVTPEPSSDVGDSRFLMSIK